MGAAPGRQQSSTSGRNKKRCHSESSVVTSRPAVEVQIPETVGSADEEDNNYYDLYTGSFDDDEVFTTAGSSQELLKKENNSTINLNELSSCLDKIQNTEEATEVDYSNLFATVEVANDVDIDKLIHDHYDQDEFVPFEYVKKLMFDEALTNSALPLDHVDFHHSIEQSSYDML